MSRTVTIKGRVVGPSTVALDEPLPANTDEVEVVARVREIEPAVHRGRLSDYLRSLPPGTRTKEDIDQQLRDERDW